MLTHLLCPTGTQLFRGRLFTPIPMFMLLLAAQCVNAQTLGVGPRFCFGPGPSGLSVNYAPLDEWAFEAIVGHTLLRADTDRPLMQRGALIAGLNAQRRYKMGDGPHPTGFYLQGGLRARANLRVLETNREQPTAPRKAWALTPDLLLGGGVFVHLGGVMELFAELNLLAFSPDGRQFGGGGEAALGLRFLLLN